MKPLLVKHFCKSRSNGLLNIVEASMGARSGEKVRLPAVPLYITACVSGDLYPEWLHKCFMASRHDRMP